MYTPQVAVLTPPGRGAVATIAVTGVGATAIVDQIFRSVVGRPIAARPTGAIAFGRWNGKGGEELVVCRRDDEHVEIHCHGGAAAPHAIVDTLVAAGCAICDWGHWLIANEADAIRRDALAALSQARTERTAAILLDQFHGGLARAIEELREIRSSGSLTEVRVAAERLLSRTPLGKHLIDPWRVVLAGRPNVGKSSLINSIVGYERSIVFDAPGTTRDVVTANTAFDGWPIELSDTAGLRASSDVLEVAGVERARQQLRSADQIVLVFDATQAWSNNDDELLATFPAAIVVHSKCDLTMERELRAPGIQTSAATGVGIAELQRAVIARLVPADIASGDAVPFLEQHFELIKSFLQ